MGAIYPLSFHRRIERQWAERIKSPTLIRSPVITATKRALQSSSGDVDSSFSKKHRGPDTTRPASIK
jgi:hypothetical protein